MRSRHGHEADVTPSPRRRWRFAGASHATVIAYVALFMAMSGTAVAATGGTFILGKTNSASSVTTLTSTAGPALSLRAPAGEAPMQVNRSVKVSRLNADLLDGRDSTAFARVGATNTGARTTLSNPDGVPLRLAAGAGAAPLQVDSSVRVDQLNADLLDGYSADDFVSADAVDDLIATNKALKSDLDAMRAEHAVLTTQIAELQRLVAGITRTTVDGRDTLRLSNVNLQLVNGTGRTEGNNGLGNLIIGYNAAPWGGSAERSGSHNLVVGDRHQWTSYAGIVAGDSNTVRGAGSSVVGGSSNAATGPYSSVTGGSGNKATGANATVSGGRGNTASGPSPAEWWWTGDYTTVVGGFGNTASGVESSILGGVKRNVSAPGGCHPACS